MKKLILALILLSGCCYHPNYKTYLTWHRPESWDIESRCLDCDRFIGIQEITSEEYRTSLVVQKIYANPHCHLIRGK